MRRPAGRGPATVWRFFAALALGAATLLPLACATSPKSLPAQALPSQTAPAQPAQTSAAPPVAAAPSPPVKAQSAPARSPETSPSPPISPPPAPAPSPAPTPGPSSLPAVPNLAQAPALAALPNPRATPAPAGSAATGAKVPPTRPRRDYLEASLADYWRETLPNGATMAVKRQAGRKTAAARIALERDPDARPEEAGFDALALSAAVRRQGVPVSAGEGLSAFEAGASIELKLEDYDDVALDLACPGEDIVDLLGFVASSLASASFSQEDFDRALREARVAERKESGDPLLRAAAELRAGLYKGHPYSQSPRGTASSLAAATRAELLDYWRRSFGAERLFVVVVCDADPRELARALEIPFGALPRRGEAGDGAQTLARVAALPIRPWFRALTLSGTPGSAVLRGEFGAPAADSGDFAALTVAFAMLDDLLLERLRGEEGLAYGAWARLSAAAAPSASLTVYKTGNPKAAKAAVDSAIAELASGYCLDAGDSRGGDGPVGKSLEAYKARAITDSYSRLASSEGMAAHIARDLAAGGDGTALFRMAGRIRAVRAEDVVRVARQRLLEGPSAWVALGDPDLVLGLPLSAFVPLGAEARGSPR